MVAQTNVSFYDVILYRAAFRVCSIIGPKYMVNRTYNVYEIFVCGIYRYTDDNVCKIYD